MIYLWNLSSIEYLHAQEIYLTMILKHTEYWLYLNFCICVSFSKFCDDTDQQPKNHMSYILQHTEVPSNHNTSLMLHSRHYFIKLTPNRQTKNLQLSVSFQINSNVFSLSQVIISWMKNKYGRYLRNNNNTLKNQQPWRLEDYTISREYPLFSWRLDLV